MEESSDEFIESIYLIKEKRWPYWTDLLLLSINYIAHSSGIYGLQIRQNI